MNTEDPAEEIKKEIKTVVPTSQNKSTLDSIEEKIDQILKYQKHVRRLAIFRGIISFLFFFIFIIAPIIGGFYLVKYVSAKVDLTKISSQYQEFYQTIESIKKSGDLIKGMEEKVKGLTK